MISIHALLAESDEAMWFITGCPMLFLSTLSLRRATIRMNWLRTAGVISIHALLAESDLKQFVVGDVMGISIHALLAESDLNAHLYYHSRGLFLSTLSLRRATGGSGVGSWPRGIFLSTLSLRRATGSGVGSWPRGIFLSTLSLRRATILPPVDTSSVKISIHALLAESDTRTQSASISL